MLGLNHHHVGLKVSHGDKLKLIVCETLLVVIAGCMAAQTAVCHVIDDCIIALIELRFIVINSLAVSSDVLQDTREVHCDSQMLNSLVSNCS